MHKLTLSLLVILVVSGGVAAQIWQDPFNYPPGPNVGSWTESRGLWNAVVETSPNVVAESEQKFLWQYCIQPNRVYQDAVVECVVTYNPKSSQKLQFGGVALRCNNPANDQDLVMVKIQDNNSNGGFDSVWLYDRPGGSVATTNISPEFKQGKARLLAIDSRVVAQVDTDMDGLWDFVLSRTTSVAVKKGPVGIDGFGGNWIDDFALFNGVLLDDTTSPKPQPGATVKFVMRGDPATVYQAASSLGTRGIPLPGGVVPLSVDGLFFASIAAFPGFAGSLDANGDGKLQVTIPNSAALVGQTFYTAFVTYGPGGFKNFSNDHQVTVVP